MTATTAPSSIIDSAVNAYLAEISSAHSNSHLLAVKLAMVSIG